LLPSCRTSMRGSGILLASVRNGLSETLLDIWVTPFELVSVLRANAQTRWTPPGIGPEAPLTDILIHTLDICHPLHISHTIEPARLRHALNFLVSRKSRVLTKPDWIAGLRLAPDDLEWSWGDGLEVRGKAQNVMMVLGGRTAMLDDLTGPGVPQLQARLLSSKSS
jgi:hypothetical protein